MYSTQPWVMKPKHSWFFGWTKKNACIFEMRYACCNEHILGRLRWYLFANHAVVLKKKTSNEGPLLQKKFQPHFLSDTTKVPPGRSLRVVSFLISLFSFLFFFHFSFYFILFYFLSFLSFLPPFFLGKKECLLRNITPIRNQLHESAQSKNTRCELGDIYQTHMAA